MQEPGLVDCLTEQDFQHQDGNSNISVLRKLYTVEGVGGKKMSKS